MNVIYNNQIIYYELRNNNYFKGVKNIMLRNTQISYNKHNNKYIWISSFRKIFYL